MLSGRSRLLPLLRPKHSILKVDLRPPDHIYIFDEDQFGDQGGICERRCRSSSFFGRQWSDSVKVELVDDGVHVDAMAGHQRGSDIGQEVV